MFIKEEEFDINGCQKHVSPFSRLSSRVFDGCQGRFSALS